MYISKTWLTHLIHLKQFLHTKEHSIKTQMMNGLVLVTVHWLHLSAWYCPLTVMPNKEELQSYLKNISNTKSECIFSCETLQAGQST